MFNSHLRRRHGLIAKILYGTVGVALALYMGLVGFKYQWNENQFDSKMDAYEQTIEANEFYEVIAGEAQPDGLGPQRSLSLQLKAALGEVDNGEPVPQEVLDFLGRPREFIGITEELGFNPFDDAQVDCTECGPLSSDVQAALQLIKDGEVQSVLIDVQQPVKNTDSSLTGIGHMWELLAVWQLAGAAGMMVGLWQHGDKRMTWLRDGQHDFLEDLCKIGAPLFMGGYLLFVNKERAKAIVAEREAILKSYDWFDARNNAEKAIAEIKKLLKGKPANAAQLLKDEEELRSVLREIDRRVYDEMRDGEQSAEDVASRLSERAQVIVGVANDRISQHDRAKEEAFS